MDKNTIADAIAVDHGLTKTKAAEIVSDIFGDIASALSGGEEVRIHGFGTFERAHHKARTARNPRTGEDIAVAAKNAVKFKAAKGLRDSVNG
jgi:DNA-binding protein HU-beta